jgi:hypothetical protein
VGEDNIGAVLTGSMRSQVPEIQRRGDMSGSGGAEVTACVQCGKTGVKLMKCTGCHKVSYCGGE